MTKLFVYLFILFLTSCASNYPKSLKVDELYLQGIQVSDQGKSHQEVLDDFTVCLNVSNSLDEKQPIISVGINKIRYWYDLHKLSKILNHNKNCESNILITDLDTRYVINNMSIRLYYYTGIVTLEAQALCQSELVSIKSEGKYKLKKHEIHDSNETEALISASIFMAMSTALDEMHAKYINTYKNKCE